MAYPEDGNKDALWHEHLKNCLTSDLREKWKNMELLSSFKINTIKMYNANLIVHKLTKKGLESGVWK